MILKDSSMRRPNSRERRIDAAAYAHNLYAVLHDLETRGVSRILVEEPPSKPEWQAIRDRLQRAAHDAR